jgi:co-chaperonin GroES (HSP10)
MEKTSDFVQAFAQTDKAFEDGAFELMGDILLVREIPQKEEKTKGGLYIPKTDLRTVDGFEANRPCWVEVLKVGSGYYEPGAGGPTPDSFEDRYVPLDSKPGDIILVGKLAVKWVSTLGTITSTPENNLGFVRETEIQARFRGRQVHDMYFEVLEAQIG